MKKIINLKNKNKFHDFFFLFYFYLKRTFCFKNILFMIVLFIIFIPIYFSFVSLFVNVIQEDRPNKLALDKWTVFLVIFNIYISFVLSYLYADLKRNEIYVGLEKKSNSFIKIIIIGMIWALLFSMLIIIFLKTSESYKYQSSGLVNNMWYNNFWLLIMSCFFCLMLINIGGMVLTAKNTYVYLGIIFIIDCCSIFWLLLIMASPTSEYYIYQYIIIGELSISFILFLLNIIKRFIFSKEKNLKNLKLIFKKKKNI